MRISDWSSDVCSSDLVVKDVRDQFKNNPGIMTYESKPDYARTVDLVTKSAIKEMIIPSLLPVLAPIVVFFVIRAVAGPAAALAALGALLLGVIVEIGRAHVCTPVTNAHLVCRTLLEKKKQT